MLGWLLAVAAAHPFGSKLAAHQIVVDVGATELAIQYRAEVPNPLVRTSTRRPDADPIREMALELRDGLRVTVDQQELGLGDSGDWEASPNDDAHTFIWRYRIPLDPGAHTIEVSNGNLPGVLAVHSAELWVTDNLEIVDCSLWRFHEGEIVLDDHGRWRATEQGREVRFQTQPAGWLRSWMPAERMRSSDAVPRNVPLTWLGWMVVLPVVLIATRKQLARQTTPQG